nr:MAG TPA: hypothetical protein [Caudoviricetes sp.]
MELNINIHETVAGDIFVKELAYEQGFYKETIPFEKSVSITVLRRNTTTKSEIIKAYIHNHKVTEVISKFKVKYDGWYDVIHFIVPLIGSSEVANNKYCSDGNLIFSYNNGQPIGVPIETVVADSTLALHVTALTQKSTFVLFNLWQCYLNYCKRILESECSKDTHCIDCSDEGTKNRNLIWIFLNAIQYYVKFGNLQAAQELLENISGCNSLCSNEMFSKLYDCRCGK